MLILDNKITIHRKRIKMNTLKLIIAMLLASSGAILADQTAAQKNLNPAEYSESVTDFNKAADYYLGNCLKGDTANTQCQQSLNVINNFLTYAKTYYTPDTLAKRIIVENTLRQRDISAREDLTPLEKIVLANCFSFVEDNYAQTYLGYKSTPNCDILIKQAGQAGSKDPNIAYEYDRILKRELEAARKARLLVMFDNLTLSHDNPAYQQTVSALKNDVALFKELLQELKYGSWIEYRQISEYVPNNRVYGGLFKAIVCHDKLKGNDLIIKNELTDIVRHWVNQGKIPNEPSYSAHKKGGRETFHGFGVAWALLRDAAVEKGNKGEKLSPKEETAIIDEILIRCGDRRERTLLSPAQDNGLNCATNTCSKLIETYQELLDNTGITIF
jgi:hypothetical protein